MGPPNGYSLGSTWIGGPLTTDAWGAHRAPSPVQLVEHFKSIAYTCAVVNANAVSAVPLKLYIDSSRGGKPGDHTDPRDISDSQFRYLQRSGDITSSRAKVSDIREVRNHRFLTVLNNPDPNGDFDLTQFLKLISLGCDILGRSYFYPTVGVGGVYQYLWPLYSQYVYPIRTAATPVVQKYQYFDALIPADEILYFSHNMSLRDPYGAAYSPLYAAIEYARLEDKFVSVQEQLMAMGPRPNLMVSPKTPDMPFGPSEKDRYEQDFMRKHARSAQGGVLVLQTPVEVHPMTYSPTDLAGLKISEYDLQQICNCFDVPLEFMTSDTNLANQQAAKSKHVDRGVRPRCKSIASRLTRVIRQWDPRLFFAFDDPLILDRETEARVFDMEIKNGSLTINQANEHTGRPPVPWGDQPWLDQKLAQPDTLQKMHDASIAMSQAGAVGLEEGGGNPGLDYKDVKKDKSKAKKGGPPKGKSSNGGDRRTSDSGKSDDDSASRSLSHQAVPSLHGEDGRLTEDENRDPFGWSAWIAEPRSERP